MAAVATVIDADMVQARMSLPSDASVVAAVESSIEGACVFLESVLTTTFKKTSRVDYFLVDKSRYLDEPPDDMVRLKLKAGFVRAAPVPVLKTADSFTNLKAGVDVATLVATDYDLDAEKGIVALNATDFDRLYLSIAYDAGFNGSTDGLIPAWLQEAALAYTITLLNYQQTTNRSDDMAVVANEARKHALNVVGLNNRNLVPFTLLPLI